jgi:hypothetical protein
VADATMPGVGSLPTGGSSASTPGFGSMMDIVKSLRPGGGSSGAPGAPAAGGAPSLNQIYASPMGNNPTYDNVFGLIKASGQMPGVTDTALPAIAQLLDSARGPAAMGINKETEANVASAQSDAMKRGLTGSDIEAGNMTMARGQGQLALSKLYADSAGKMGDYIMQAVTGDVQSQRENLLNLAQAFGQKISSDQELAMFQQQLAASMGMADRANKTSLWGAGIGAVGSIAGGAMRFSDRQLKDRIQVLGRAGRLEVVSFEWNKAARYMGAPEGEQVGVLADQVEKAHPALVATVGRYKAVDYAGLPSDVKRMIRAHGGH